MPNTEWVDALSPEQEAELRALALAAGEVDGWPQVAPDGPLPREFSGGAHLLARDDQQLIGYVHLDEQGDAFGREVAELIVHPEHRGRGVGGTLLDAVRERAAQRRPQPAEPQPAEPPQPATLRLWSHGDHPAAARLAARAGLVRVRELHRMRAALEDVPRTTPALPAGVTLRTFEPGTDEPAVIDVNARAFSWHPEQGALTVEDLRATEREAWFDPKGFFLAVRGSKLLGFHWTKVHPAGPEPDALPLGEVYVVGVDRDAQGGGLGKALTLAGLEHLRALGLREVILYVEGDNAAALAVYRGLGFAFEVTGVQYESHQWPGSPSDSVNHPRVAHHGP